MRLPHRGRRLFIVVNPVNSGFAKTLQTSLRSQVSNRILRTSRVRDGRSCFHVTPTPLDKIQQLRRFTENAVACPKFTTDRNGVDALGSRLVFARLLVNSTNGRGIVEFNPQEQRDFPNAPLYTEYIAKKVEYRVHVFNREVIDIQQKKKRRGFDDERNTRVRNTANGYVYCRDGIDPPNGIADLSIRATAACNYQYGAVDVIYNKKMDKLFVLEVNSRPGLMGTTLEKYSEAIINEFNLEKK